eukprot:8091332-Pyramimonas_sp.AAC.1
MSFERQENTPKLEGFNVSGPGKHSFGTLSTPLWVLEIISEILTTMGATYASTGNWVQSSGCASEACAVPLAPKRRQVWLPPPSVLLLCRSPLCCLRAVLSWACPSTGGMFKYGQK